MPIAFTAGSETVGTTPHYLVSDSTTPTYQTTDCQMSFVLDLSDMVAGDNLLIQVWEKTPTTARAIYQCNQVGVQSEQFMSITFNVGIGWEISLDCIAGTTIAVTWTICTITAA